MHSLRLVCLQPLRHAAQHRTAHFGTTKHQFPKGVFVQANELAGLGGGADESRSPSREQWNLAECLPRSKNSHQRPAAVRLNLFAAYLARHYSPVRTLRVVAVDKFRSRISVHNFQLFQAGKILLPQLREDWDMYQILI